MKNLVLIFSLILFSGIMSAQTIRFHEDFESLPLDFTSSGTVNWDRSSHLLATGLYSDSASLTTHSDTAMLTSISFITTGDPYVYLEFDQICKVSFFEGGIIELSLDSGTTWTQLPASAYRGSGQYGNIGNRFTAVSYVDWLPADANAIPQNNWWKHEEFELTALAGDTNKIMLRFILLNTYGSGGGSDYGWLIDNVKVTSGPDELDPPEIEMIDPIIKDTAYYTGPFEINAKMRDASGIDTAFLVYTFNNVSDTIGMNFLNKDTSNYEHWMGTLPSMPFNSSFCYKVVAIDSSLMSNIASEPGIGCTNVIILRPYDDIEIGLGATEGFIAPMYNDSINGTKKYSEHIGLYTASELNHREADFIELTWEKLNNSGYTSSNATLKIYMKHTTSDTVSSVAGSFAVAKTGATLVYDSTGINLPANIQKLPFVFNKDTFHYDGIQNVMILVEWHRLDTLTDPEITWKYTTASSRAVTFAGSTSSPSTAYGFDQLPNVSIKSIPFIYNYDIGVSHIVKPEKIHISSTATDITVRVHNFGTDTINKMNVHYSIDGQSPNSYAWTGILDGDIVSSEIIIGSENLTKGPHTIASWTSLPNDSNDMYLFNDTLQRDFYVCHSALTGSYTVGGSGAAFPNFELLQEQLNNCGVSGPVTFVINSGNYNENINIMDVPGASSVNTITFVSSTNNADDVQLAYLPASTADNYVVKLENASWVRFKNISLRNLKADAPRVIELNDSSQNNTFENCKISVLKTANGYSYGVYSVGNRNSFNKYINNDLSDLSFGIYLTSFATHAEGNIIEGNEIHNFKREAVTTIRQDDVLIKANIITAFETSTYAKGINCNGTAKGLEVIENKIDLNLLSSVNAITINSSNGTANDRGLVANNFVIVRGASSNNGRSCFEIGNSGYIDVYHNSFALYSGGQNSRTVYINGNNHIRLVNNIYSNFNQGICFEVSNLGITSAISYSDYNSYFSAGVVYGKWGYNGSLYTSTGVPDLTANSQTDSNSVFTDPLFYSVTDLHSFSSVLDGAAKSNIGVITDIDGDLRDSSTPDIGADEYTRSTLDVGIIDLINPIALDTQSRVTSPMVIVRNFGIDTVHSFQVKYRVNGGSVQSVNYVDTLAYSQTDTIVLPSMTVPVLNYNIQAYTQLSGDTLNSNDTISRKLYGMPLVDIEAVSLVGPDDACGMGANEEVTIKIRNLGLTDIKSGITVSYQLQGSPTIVSETVTDTLLIGADLDYTFSTKADLTVGIQDSLFVFLIEAHHNSDPISINNTASGKVLSLGILPAPVASDTTIYYGNSVVLTASSPNNIVWYDSDTTQLSLAYGTTYTTPKLFDTTTYYVESNTNVPAMTKYLGQDLTTNTAGAPYCVYNGGGATHQILIYASELQAMGIQAGDITSLAFYIESTNYNTNHAQFTIKMGNTTATALTTNFLTTPMVEVFKKNFTEASGWNIHNFTTPFTWDGTSNVVIDFLLFTNNSNPLLRYTPTSFNSVAYSIPYGGGTGVSTKRPNMRFTTDAILGCAGTRTPLVVSVPPPTIEASMIAVSTPSQSCGLDITDVACQIVNMGTDTIPSGYSVSYKIDNGMFITPEVVNMAIAPHDTLTYTFNTKALLPSGPIGTSYSITAAVSVTNDFYNDNDTIVLSDIWSEYTPNAPVIASTPTILYADTAFLSASSTDTIYWYQDALGMQVIGDGTTLDLGPLYDTTIVYANAVKTVPLSPFIIGNGTSNNTQSVGPSPYGGPSYQAWGLKNQFFIPATEMRAMGMLKGEIFSLAFKITTVSGNSHNGYTVKMGTTTQQELNSFEPTSSLTTVYTSVTSSEVLGWNTITFSSPFFWDGVSNIVVETCYKNTQWVTSGYAKGPYTTTSYKSALASYAGSSFSCTDTIKDNTYYKRPNIKFMAKGYGSCPSSMAMQQIDVSGIPAVDASIVDIVSPIDSISACQAEDIKVVLRNYGTNTLTSANIHWRDRDSIVHTYNWTGSLLTSEVDTVTIASHQFYGGKTQLAVWSSMPNAIVDTIPINDSAFIDLEVKMSGTYTVGSGMDYPSLTEAFADLLASSVCGPVVLDIDSGNYLNQYTLATIGGVSATNTITIKSIGNDSNTVHLSFGTNGIANYVLRLSSSSYVNIKHITFNANGNSTSNSIVLEGTSNHVNIENCVMNSSTNTSIGAKASGVYVSDGDVGYLSIKNNQFNNGYSSVFVKGSPSNKVKSVLIQNNRMDGYSHAGVEADYQDSLIIDGNVMNSGINGSQVYGISIRNTINSYRITGNNIKIIPSMNGWGLKLVNLTASTNNRAIIANNMLVILNGNGTNIGTHIWNTSNVDFVYNSINVLNGTSSNFGLKIQGGSGLKILNNVIATEKGQILELNTSSSITSCDYNNYYTDTITNPLYIKWVGDVTSLTALKVIDPNNNAHSISTNPSFYSNSDLHSYEGAMNGAATPISHTQIDIDGDIRNTTTPDIGADEFVLFPIDLGLIKLTHPDASGCGYTTSDSISIQLRNYGTNTIDFSSLPATITLYSKGVNPDTIVYTINSGTIAPNTLKSILITNSFNLAMTGTYVFDANIAIAGDGNTLNDNMPTQEFMYYQTISIFPFAENFESGYSYYLGSDKGSESNMQINQDGASSSNFGMRFTGGDNSSFVPNTTVTQAYGHTQHVASLYSCQIDATNLPSLNLRFDLRQQYYLNAYGSWFRVIVSDQNGDHYAKNTNGDSTFRATTPKFDPFTTHTFVLDNYIGQVISIRLEAALGAAIQSNGTGDIVDVDNINIWSPVSIDISMVSIQSLEAGYLKAGTIHYPQIGVENFGSTTITSVPISYSVNGQAPQWDTISTNIPGSASAVLTMNKGIVFTGGDQDLCIIAHLPNDAVALNDTVCVTVKGLNEYGLSYEDDFEGADEWFGTGTSSQWEKGAPNSTNFTSAYSGTQVYATVLDGDYLVGSTEILYSPYFNIPNTSDSASFEFMQQMQVQPQLAYGYIEYSFNGTLWLSLGYIGAAQSQNWYNTNINGHHAWSFQSSNWLASSFKFSPSQFGGKQVQFRFVFKALAAVSAADGWMIDDMKLVLPPQQFDAGVVHITLPDTSSTAGVATNVEVVIHNYGYDTLTQVPISYSIDGQNIMTEIWSGTLPPDSNASFAFTTTYLSPKGSYMICSKTKLTSDANTSNDEYCKMLHGDAPDWDAAVVDIYEVYNAGGNIVKISVANLGNKPIVNLPVSYKYGSFAPVQETMSTTINSNDTVTYTFTQPASIYGGITLLCGTSYLANDMVPSNDKLCKATTGIKDAEYDGLVLNQNQPNPFSNTTRISYTVPKPGDVQLRVINTLGIVVFEDRQQNVNGTFEKDYNFSSLSPGIYYYSIIYEGRMLTKKMIIQ